MADEQVAAWMQLPVKFFHQGGLCLLVKIDNHIAAEDHILPFLNTEMIIHEVDPLEADQRT